MNHVDELPDEEREVSLPHLLAALGTERWLVIIVTILGGCLAVAAALLLPRKYAASTLILPPQQQQSAAAGALAQLGVLAGVAGGAAGIKSPDEMYVAFLKTRRLQDTLIRRFKLEQHYDVTGLELARIALAGASGIVSDKKSGLISVSVEDKDRELAAELANAYVQELRKMLVQLAVTEAQQRRLFFEQQVSRATAAMSRADVEFRRKQAESGLVITQALAESRTRAGIELRSLIAAKEVQLQALSRFATPQSAEAQGLAAELAALRQQLRTVESGGGATTPSPLQGMDAVKAYRELKTQEAALEALIRQYEIAKLDESREGPLLQQVDPAIPSEFPSQPKRTLIVVIGTLSSFMLAILVALARVSMRSNPVTSAEWRRVKSAWVGKGS